MSFDPQVFDEGVFGSQGFGSCLFDPAIFDPAMFDVCDDEVAVEETVPVRREYKFRPGYIAPRRKKKTLEPPAVVEIAVERQEIKYVAVRQQTVIGPSVAPIMAAVEEVTRLIEARARNAEIRAKLEELEEEEDIIIILSQLQ